MFSLRLAPAAFQMAKRLLTLLASGKTRRAKGLAVSRSLSQILREIELKKYLPCQI